MIILPNNLYKPFYVEGLREPLLAVADALDEKDKHSFALSLREIDSILVWYLEYLKALPLKSKA